jgi:predicted phosphodiesterase
MANASIAPVFAIKGNVDTGRWAEGLPAERTVEVDASRIFVLHNLADLNFDPAFGIMRR